jgi:hypothetical protein
MWGSATIKLGWMVSLLPRLDGRPAWISASPRQDSESERSPHDARRIGKVETIIVFDSLEYIFLYIA